MSRFIGIRAQRATSAPPRIVHSIFQFLQDSNLCPDLSGYEPNELPLLHPALYIQYFNFFRTRTYVPIYRDMIPIYRDTSAPPRIVHSIFQFLQDSNLCPDLSGYEPNELPLLHPALYIQYFNFFRTLTYVPIYRDKSPTSYLCSTPHCTFNISISSGFEPMSRFIGIRAQRATSAPPRIVHSIFQFLQDSNLCPDLSG